MLLSSLHWQFLLSGTIFVVIYALLIHLEYQCLIGESVHLHKDLAKTSSFPNRKILSFWRNKEFISSMLKQIIYL